MATRADTNATSGKTGGQVQWFSIVFVIALLVAVFRSALAPLIAVLPALVVVLVAERLTAEAAVHGLGVSQIASLLLIVLVLGAGTDYALFLMFRVREEMRAGLACHEAIIALGGAGRRDDHVLRGRPHRRAAVAGRRHLQPLLRPGGAAGHRDRADARGRAHPAARAARDLRPGGVLAVLGPGRAPAGPGGGAGLRPDRAPSAWPRWSPAWSCSAALAVASAGYLAAGFGGPATAPGRQRLRSPATRCSARHFPQTAANPTIIVLRLRQPAWAAPAAVAAAERQLAADPVFTSVSGPLNANGTALTAAQYTALYAAYGPPRETDGLGRGPGPAGQAGRVPVLPGQRLRT